MWYYICKAMEQVHDYPPNYKAICKAIPGVADSKNVVFTYGGALYNPYKGPIDEPLAFHEATHSLQQDAEGPEKWWDKYLTDVDFRYKQEVEAYHNQYTKFCKTNKDRNLQTRFLYSLAGQLASEIYGLDISIHEAAERIRQ